MIVYPREPFIFSFACMVDTFAGTYSTGTTVTTSNKPLRSYTVAKIQAPLGAAGPAKRDEFSLNSEVHEYSTTVLYCDQEMYTKRYIIN
jgi:hypothetical protein